METKLRWIEQSAMNYAAAELGIPLQLMDETWNYIHPEQVGHWDWMEHYVYHFAGAKDRDKILKVINWRMPLSNMLGERPAERPRMRKIVTWCDTRLRHPSAKRLLLCVKPTVRTLGRIPVLGVLLRYLYRWVTLPLRLNRTLDNLQIIREKIAELTSAVQNLNRKDCDEHRD